MIPSPGSIARIAPAPSTSLVLMSIEPPNWPALRPRSVLGDNPNRAAISRAGTTWTVALPGPGGAQEPTSGATDTRTACSGTVLAVCRVDIETQPAAANAA